MIENIYIQTYYAFILASAVLLIISIFTSGTSSTNVSIAGFCTLTVSILLIMTIILSAIYKNATSVYYIIFTLAPFLLILFSIAFYLYLSITYKGLISSGNILSDYYSFQKTSVILVLLETCMFYYGMDKKTGKISTINTSFIYLLCIMNIIVLYTMRTILAYFSTDG